MMLTLVLNADWAPLNFVSPVRAISMMLKGRAEVITAGDTPSVWRDEFKTPSTTFVVPATLRLLERVSRRRLIPRFRKWVLFNRDDWCCQYCGVHLDRQGITIDHVVPRAMGGETTWFNCVASCKKCNWKKGARTPSEASMVLRRRPAEPDMMHFWESENRSVWHEDWHHFFSNMYSQ